VADTEWVRIECPGIDGTALVAARSLDHWRARGWVEAAEPAPKPRGPAKPVTAKTPAVAPPDQAAPKPADNPKDEG
jgi:hypothetical protein